MIGNSEELNTQKNLAESAATKLQVVEDYAAELDRQLMAGGEEEEKERDVVIRRVAQEEEEERSRSYDLSITWDKFYQTPRLWLRGFKTNTGDALNEKQVREDVLGEYASKTVTMEIHPATGEITASIHPCKHAEMMKRVIQTWKEKKFPIRSDLSLFVFLKFISGVVPTINYDFTFDLEMNSA
jgi:ubiquitin-like-conjugating enzyme ATG3